MYYFFFLIFSLSLTLIVWVVQAVNFLEFVAEDGHSFKIYIFYTLLNIPKVFSRILPFVFFISVFYTLIKYEDNNELVIFWTNGINKIQFINKLVKFSLIIAIFQILLTTLIVPKTQDMARSYIRSSNIDFFPSLIKEKTFVDTVKNLTIFIEEKKDNKYYKNFFLKDDFGNDSHQIIYAKKGEININENIIILQDGEIINRNNEKLTRFSFKKSSFDLSRYKTKTITFPKIQEWRSTNLINCIFLIYEKGNFEKFNCKMESFVEYIREIFRRIFSPLFIPTIILVSSLLIIKSKHDFSYTFLKFLLFVMGILTIVLSELIIRYIGSDQYNVLFFISSPLIIYFFLYLIFQRKLT